MLRRLLRFVLNLVVIALCFVLVTMGWIVFDGLNDIGERADFALVIKTPGDTSANVPALERAARLYRDGAFPQIIVCAPDSAEPREMVAFLVAHGVPDDVILRGPIAPDEADAVVGAAKLMTDREAHTVMIVADYYRVTRIKVALLHAGISSIDSAHARSAGFADVVPVGYEAAAIYSYLFHTYVMPVSKRLESEASAEAVKAREQADKAGAAVQKHLDDLPK